jgi:intermediate peptidase
MLSRSLSAVFPKQLFHFQGRRLLSTYDTARYRRCLSIQASTIPASVDDIALVSLFDHPKSGIRTTPFSTTGLFGHPSLNHPRGLISLAEATLVRAQLLTDRILRARESRDELLKVVKNLDRLSDMLCAVIDLSELVRNAHPDRIWVEAANHAYETLCESMNVLNTNVGLYEVRQYIIAGVPRSRICM